MLIGGFRAWMGADGEHEMELCCVFVVDADVLLREAERVLS